MAKIMLNKRLIELRSFAHGQVDGLHEIVVEFEVTSGDYHEIATLLYEKIFTVEVPELHMLFTGEIRNYATSFINLYEKDQVAIYSLTLREVRGEA